MPGGYPWIVQLTGRFASRVAGNQPSARFGRVRNGVVLIAAITVEVAATLSLRASQEHSAWLVVVAVGWLGSFLLRTMVLRARMPVRRLDGLWGGSGTAAKAVLHPVMYGDP